MTFIFLKALIIFDYIKFELGGNPGGKFHRNIYMSEGAPISPGFGLDSYSPCHRDPFLRGEDKRVTPCVSSKLVEFDQFKIRVIQLLP